MDVLTRQDIRRAGPPLRLIQSVVSVLMVVLFLIEAVADPLVAPDQFLREPLNSLPYLVSGLQVTVIGLAVTVWVAPRTSLALLAPAGALLPLAGTSIGPAWPLVGLAALATLGWLLWPLRRPDPAPVGPTGVPADLWSMSATRSGVLKRVAGVTMALAAVVVLVGALVVHARDVADTRAFEHRALRLTATAVEPAADDTWVYDIGGRRLTRPGLVIIPMAPGQRYAVLVDPLDPDRVAFAVEPEDPSWLIGLAALAPTLLAWGVGALMTRPRQDALVLRGGPTRRAMLQSGRKAYLEPVGDPDGPALSFTSLQATYVPPDWERGRHYGPLRWDEQVLRDLMREDEPGDPQAEDDHQPGDMVPVDAHELAAWADGARDELASRLSLKAPAGPLLHRDVEATIVGRVVQGAPVVVRLDDGRVYLGELRTSWQTASPRHWWVLAASLLQWHGRLLRWLVVPLAVGLAVLGIWLVEPGDHGFLHWLRLLLIHGVLVAAPVQLSHWLGADAVCPDSQGLRTLGMFTDEVICSANVLKVTAGHHSVALRLTDPADAKSLDPLRFRSHDVDSPEDAAELARSWLAQAGPEGRSRRVPTPGLIGAVLMVVIWAVASGVWLLG
ncbi:hypothetical protein ACQB6R_00695 [Propionibacteriaceae bacterium G1746]